MPHLGDVLTITTSRHSRLFKTYLVTESATMACQTLQKRTWGPTLVSVAVKLIASSMRLRVGPSTEYESTLKA